MSNHLSDEELIALTLNESGRAVDLHIQECPECHEASLSLRGAINEWVEDVAAGASASGSFWARQRAAIAERAAQSLSLRPWMRWAWGAATITLVLVASGLFFQRPFPTTKRTPVDDNALLLSVHESLDADVPQALEPVTLLTQEIDRAEVSRKTVSN